VKLVEWSFFFLCALLAAGGGVATIASRKPIRSAMGLLATILGVAGCYLLLSAEFLAAIQLIVYAGAVVILFIFVVMLLGSATESPSDAGSAVPRYVGASVFGLCLAYGVYLVGKLASTAPLVSQKVSKEFGTIEAIGHEIFTSKVVPFELTGALLLVAVVGALAVGRGKQVDPTVASEKEAKGAASGASEVTSS
jgi:NADH-quinone oxidoreductase subunit J